MSDRETIAVYDARAQEYSDLVTDFAEDPSLQDFMQRLPAGGAVLDLGCGPGNAASVFAEAGFTTLAWDASSEMVALAGAHPSVTAEQRVFDDLAALPPASLDGVWANFSLLHAPRDAMPGHLSAIRNALRPEGHFLIAVKEGTGEVRDSIGRLYTYFTREELQALLTEAGFRVLNLKAGRDAGLSGEEADWISLTCQADTQP